MVKKKNKRTIKLNAEAMGILEKQRKMFIAKFGREPGPRDPVFFDPDSDVPTTLNEEKMSAGVLAAMLQAGTPPQIVYAYRKTGFIVNETSYHNMPPEDQAEYNAAIDEYFRLEDSSNLAPN